MSRVTRGCVQHKARKVETNEKSQQPIERLELSTTQHSTVHIIGHDH